MNDWLFTDMMKRELEAIFGVGFAVARFEKKNQVISFMFTKIVPQSLTTSCGTLFPAIWK